MKTLIIDSTSLLKKTNSVDCSRHAHFETVVHSQAQRYSISTWPALFSKFVLLSLCLPYGWQCLFAVNTDPCLTFVCYWSRLFQLQFWNDMRDEEKGDVYKILFGKP
jgi:hypothetical protein